MSRNHDWLGLATRAHDSPAAIPDIDLAKLVPKTLQQQVSALEDHLFLLARTLTDMAEGESAHLKQLAAQLRALICTSSGMPGLLWRLRDEVGADDGVPIRYPGKVDTANPLTRGLIFLGAPVQADGSGPEAIPQDTWSFHQHIHEHEALFVDGVGITHEYLISRLANETGVAHEAHGVSKDIAKLNSVLLGDVQSYFQVLDADARLTLIVGDRVVRGAEARGYIRRRLASLPETIPKFESARFASRPDVPAHSMHGREGTILMVLQLPKHKKEDTPSFPICFPSMSQGPVTVRAEMSRRGKIQVSSQGLPFPHFGFDFYLDDPAADSIVIAITWSGLKTKGFAADRQVAGPVEADNGEA